MKQNFNSDGMKGNFKMKAALAGRRLTQQRAAKLLGLSAPSFSRIVTGRRVARRAERRTLGELLGIDANTPRGAAQLRQLLPIRRRRRRTREAS